MSHVRRCYATGLRRLFICNDALELETPHRCCLELMPLQNLKEGGVDVLKTALRNRQLGQSASVERKVQRMASLKRAELVQDRVRTAVERRWC